MDPANFLDMSPSSTADISLITPDRPRLGKFVDVYSPEHLNLTPKHRVNPHFNNDSNNQGFHTPEQFYDCKNQCRTVRPQRQIESTTLNCSFEGNQSFPRLKKRIRPIKMELETPTKVKSIVDQVRVDGPNGLRFNTTLPANEITGSPAHNQNLWQQSITSTKAVFTIEPNTSKILIVNNKASSLLGYSTSDLCGSKFFDLLYNKAKSIKLQEPEDGDSEDGTAVLLSGKVVELLTKNGDTVQVSLWIRQLDNDGPCLVVAEPVNCKNVTFTVDPESGSVLSVDSEEAALLFQADCAHKLVGLPIGSLIPSVRLPPSDRVEIPGSIYKQKLTGRTLDGGSFPLCLWITRVDNPEPWSAVKVHKDKSVLAIRIRVTLNVSGLLVVDELGTITACNHHFAALTFGKAHTDVIGRYIEEVIPNFCRESDYMKMNERNRNMTLSPVNNEVDGSVSDTDEDSCGAFNGSQKSACMSLNVQQSQQSQISQPTIDKSSSALCLDKSSSIVTHTPTPTQDMVSSISTTEQRNDIPDVTSGMSGISIEEDAFQSSISKSRSENILRSEQSNPQIKVSAGISEQSDSYASQNSEDVTPTGNSPNQVKVNDSSQRLSFDTSKYKSYKTSIVNDKTSLSLDFCDSNETSADFLTPINEMPAPGCVLEDLPKHNGNESLESLSNDIDLETQTESAPRRKYDDDCPETPCVVKRVLRNHVTTSTPQHSRLSRVEPQCDCTSECKHKDGTYRGIVLHRDGTELNVLYTVSSMQLLNGRRVRCIWLGVKSEDPPRHTTLASSVTSTADNSLMLGNKSVSSRPQSMSLMSQCGEEQVAGEFSKHYVTLKQIGKGAFGCVKMAYRRSDRLLCVAKFILKDKVGAQFWVDGPDGKRVPLEVSLLLTLKHPNIVSVLDMYENDKYFQMVMEKHGAGMDLFEFIDRRPRMDEPLLSFIFRQIGQAVEYLHSLNILHRDIKDENVIIDNKFHVKLIDFGSATFMSKDTLFSTFYGTTEYCSPEVLAGNKYAGPELEMWSMGITLYVLTFFVDPFSDIEDTIQGPLMLPQPVSEDLEHLLRWMLCKDPTQRITVTQLIAHPWIKQPVTATNYLFHEVVDCDRHEANPEMYYSGSFSPKSESQLSLADPLVKERSNPSEVAIRSDKNVSRDEPKRSSLAMQALSTAEKDAQSDNYSLRSSADILDISSKPVSEAALTDISYECDSWDECEQDSFS